MVIVCDFDDTTAEQNVAVMLLERFGGGQPSPEATETSDIEWRRLHRQFQAREIPLWQYQERVFSRMEGSREEQRDFVRAHARLRSGFPELAAFCRERGVGLAVVSHGLAFYLDATLDSHGLGHLPRYAVETAGVDGRTTFAYPFTKPGCDWWGNCKCRVIEGYRAQGHRVVYAGDGMSDACPARQADFVFARSQLLETCRREGIPHRELSDFHQVVAWLRDQGSLETSAPQSTAALEMRLRFD